MDSAAGDPKARGRQEYRNWIDFILEQKGWNGTELAKKAGLAASTILRPLNDKNYEFAPSFRTISQISRASGYKPSPSMLEAFELRDAGLDAYGISAETPRQVLTGDVPETSEIRKGEGGRTSWPKHGVKLAAGDELVLPVSLREAIGVGPGETVMVEVHGDELRLRPVLAALRRLQARLKAVLPEGYSLADELIAERRAEAARD